MVTRVEKLTIWIQFEITRPVTAIKSLRFALFFAKLPLEILSSMNMCWSRSHYPNTLGPRQNGCHFADDCFKFDFSGICVFVVFSLKCVHKALINNKASLGQIMTWHRIGDNPWWRHQMKTFSALLAICAGNSPVPGEFPAQRPVTWSFDVFFDPSE